MIDTRNQTGGDIQSLIDDLGSANGQVRQEARQSLLDVGQAAVPALTQALSSSKEVQRREAAKALSEIADPSSAPALVDALEDDNLGVRWLAAEGLIAMHREGLKPLLRALIRHSDSVWLREGAHHVLRVLARRGIDEVDSVVEALEDVEPDIESAEAAQAALRKLD